MWARIVNIAAGIWLMFAPWALGLQDPAAGSDRTVGPLIVTFAIMAIWEVLRPLRWVNFAFAVWLVVIPVFWNFPLRAVINDVVIGLLVAGLALVRGSLTQKFGGGWRSIFRQKEG